MALKHHKKRLYLDSEVFNALVQLYKHNESAPKLLERVRINPDLHKNAFLRIDLEFFIPQLCSFYLNN